MKVGFADLVITPNLINRKKGLQLAGYSPRKLCTGVHDDLFARAVYFESEEKDIKTHFLMIVCDVLSLDGKFLDIAKKFISKSIPISAENIMISATHTHHGPDYSGIFLAGGSLSMLLGLFFPRPETEELFLLGKKLVRVAKTAYNARKKAKMGSAQTEIPEKDRVMINRRDLFNFEKARYPVTVIKVVSDEQKDKGQIYGVIVNYACHGTVLPYKNTLITADYIGYVVKTLNDHFSDSSVNCLYFNGPCGEINHLTLELKRKIVIKGPEKVSYQDIYSQQGTWEDAQRIGDTIANCALKALYKINYTNDAHVRVLTKPIRIPIKDYQFGSDLKSAIIKLFYRAKLQLYSWLKTLAILKNNVFFKIEASSLKKDRTISTSLQAAEIGDFVFVTAPGEYFLELGNGVILYANNLFPDKKSFVIELANDSIGYLYTIEAYLKVGYESTFSIIPLGGIYVTIKLKKLLSELKNMNY